MVVRISDKKKNYSKVTKLLVKPKTINSILLLTLILSCNFIQTISVFANEIEPNPAIEARADIIEWRYKLENGRVYKRRYNYTKQKWIGDWIPA